ncbi:MAG: FAD binding domain-containing protein [Actinomycetota bacterium]|nr:FAD binding domain-containing protein [Actinomycetota bacterium]
MEVLSPSGLQEALLAKSEVPSAVPLAGGTDLMVDLNFDRRRPDAVIDLTRVPELTGWERADGVIRLGAGVTYARLVAEVAPELPGLAIAARTVGSPQIRNRGTVGGNLGTASPAGDALPPLLAAGAQVEVASATAARSMPLTAFITGPKTTALEPGELITAVSVPVATGPQQFSKIGTRNAMVIAVTSFALALHPERREVTTAIGSAGPRPLVAAEAESFLGGVLDEAGLWDARGAIPPAAAARFGELVAGAAQPIDDVRGTIRYRRHALGVLARRTLAWAWDDFRKGPR